MVSTYMLPGIPGVSPNVNPTALKFVNDAIYSTFFSEKASKEFEMAEEQLLSGAPGFNLKYLSIGIAPEDLESSFRGNINELLAGPYNGSVIAGATLALELIEDTSEGKILHWKIVLTTEGGDLITGLLTGAVLYSIS